MGQESLLFLEPQEGGHLKPLPRQAAYGCRGQIPHGGHGHSVGPTVLRARAVKGRLVTECGVTVTKVEPFSTAEARELPDSGTLGLSPPHGPRDEVEMVWTGEPGLGMNSGWCPVGNSMGLFTGILALAPQAGGRMDIPTSWKLGMGR